MNLHRPAIVLGCLVLAACGQAASDPAGDNGNGSGGSQVSPVATVEPVADADPIARGEALFARCTACHSVEPGTNGIGPSLHAIVGKASGSQSDYTYSSAMLEAQLTWDEQTLSAYLENPSVFVPGNKMAFAGLQRPEERADLIAYLATLN